MKILPQQSEFPQLVSNILPDVRHRPIRTHNNLVLRILFLFCLLRVLCALCALCVNSRLFSLLPRHNPATSHLPASRELYRPRFLQHLERSIPELQVQNLALPRQQLVADIQPRHRPQVASDNRVRHDLRHLRILAFALLDRLQRLPAQLRRPPLVRGKEARRLRIHLPAVIIELWFRCAGIHPNRRDLFHLQQANHYVRHLHARVINVILNLHTVPRVPQDPHHRVAQHCISYVADVRRLVRIDARMLDDDFSVLLCVLCVSALSSLSVLLAVFLSYSLPKCRAVEKRIQIPATRHFNLGNPVDPAQTVRNLLRNLSRRLLQPLRQFKTHRRSRLPHLNLRRPLQHDRQLHAIFLANVPRQRLAQPVRQFLIHVSSFGVRQLAAAFPASAHYQRQYRKQSSPSILEPLSIESPSDPVKDTRAIPGSGDSPLPPINRRFLLLCPFGFTFRLTFP